MEQVLYKTEAYQIIGLCMDVYNTLGYGFAEVVYKDAMEIEFVEKNIQYRREHLHVIKYKGRILQHKFFADYTLYNSIILEVKTGKDGITDDAVSQTLNYLRASGIRLGIIINFGKTGLEYKRLVY